jgi:hypothetical protein
VKKWDSMMQTYNDKQYVERYCTLHEEDTAAVVNALKSYLKRRAALEPK